MLNVEQNPSRRINAVKIIDNMKFTMPVDREFIKYQIKEELGKMVYGYKWTNYRDAIKSEKRFRIALEAVDAYPDDYVFDRDSFDDYFELTSKREPSSKTEIKKILKQTYDHIKKNYKYHTQLMPTHSEMNFYRKLLNVVSDLAPENMVIPILKDKGLYDEVINNTVIIPDDVEENYLNVKKFINLIEVVSDRRQLKLETLPKSYSDYLINAVVRKQVNYYLIFNTFAGAICRMFTRYSLPIVHFLPDSHEYTNEKIAQKEIECLFAMSLCHEINDILRNPRNSTSWFVSRIKRENTENVISKENLSLVFHGAMTGFYNNKTKDLSPEDFDKNVLAWEKEYRPLFYKILKLYAKINDVIFSRSEKEFQYKDINEAVKDFYKNIRPYENQKTLVGTRNSNVGFRYFHGDIDSEYVESTYFDYDGIFGETFDDSLYQVNIDEIKNKLIHFSEMRNVVPELKKYELNTKYPFYYHYFTMVKMEIMKTVEDGEDAIVEIDKRIKILHEKKPLNYLKRIDGLDTARVNIRKNIEHIKSIMEGYKGRNIFSVNAEHLTKSYANDLLRWLEKLGGGKKLKKEGLEWGLEILTFDKSYKPFIEHTESPLFLDKGYFWERISHGFSEKERDAMGHCGNAGRNEEDFIYSLRRRYKDGTFTIHVTLTVMSHIGVTVECKGKGNASPIEDYWPYLVELFIRDDIIQCAESGLGYAGDRDFNINMSKDAVDNMEKIKKVKPFLFSQVDLIFGKHSKENLSDLKKGLTETQIFELFCRENPSWACFFAFGVSTDKTHSILEPFEKNPLVMNGKEFLKTKEILIERLINHLKEKDAIRESTFFNTEKTYEIDFTIKNLFEEYEGRKLFDEINDKKGETGEDLKISIKEMLVIDFKGFTFDTDKEVPYIVDFLKREFNFGFKLYTYHKYTTNDKTIEYVTTHDAFSFLEEFAKDNKGSTWMASYVSMDRHYESEPSRLDNYDLIETFKYSVMKDAFVKFFSKSKKGTGERAFEIINSILQNEELFKEDFAEIKSNTLKALWSMSDQDCTDQITSQFHDIVFEFLDYDKKTETFTILFDNIFDYLIELTYDDWNFVSITDYHEFISFISYLYTQKYFRNKDIPTKEELKKLTREDVVKKDYENFIEHAKNETSNKKDAKRFSPVFLFINKFFNNFNWDKVSDFQPSEYDFVVTDKDIIGHFVELFFDDLNLELTSEKLEEVKKIIKGNNK